MEYQKFIPEGWKITDEKICMNDLKEAMETNKVLQGLVSKCDKNYNLHINLSHNIKGIIPKEEVELTPNIKESIYKNKENTFVQFKVKEIDSNSNVILSRRDVTKDALNWIKDELKVGNVVCGIVKNIRPFGAFIEIGGGVVRTFTY